MQNTLANITNLQILYLVIIEDDFLAFETVTILICMSVVGIYLSSFLIFVKRSDKQSTL